MTAGLVSQVFQMLATYYGSAETGGDMPAVLLASSAEQLGSDHSLQLVLQPVNSS